MEIQLINNGGVAVVDDDMSHLARHVWARSGHHKVTYAVRRERLPDGRYKSIRMHREIMGAIVGGRPIDHINGNGLDNRRENLRFCTHTENVRNVSGPTKVSKTGFRGVTLIPKTGRYRAKISVDGRRISLGVYETAREANEARLAAEREMWGVTPRREADYEALEGRKVVLNRRPNWTKDQDDLLKKMAGSGGFAIASRVGRTVKAVYGRAATLGVRLG